MDEIFRRELDQEKETRNPFMLDICCVVMDIVGSCLRSSSLVVFPGKRGLRHISRPSSNEA